MAINNESRLARMLPPLPLYLAGLVMIVLGERVFASRPAFQVTLLVLGGICIIVGALPRLAAPPEQHPQRTKIDHWMALLTLGTGVAIALSLLVQHQPELFGIRADLPIDVHERRVGLWNVIWISAVLFTLVPLLFAEAALYPMRKAPLPEVRRVHAAALAGLTLALVAVYGSLFAYAGNKFGVATDYSYFKTAKPSESTKRIARGLKDPVRVVALFPSVNDVRREVENYLRDLGRTAPKIQIEFHDRLLEPKVARELRASNDGSIILVRGEVRQFINVGVDQKNARPVLRKLDEEFQKNLMKLARDVRVAYLTVGHGELNDKKDRDATSEGQGVQILKKLLETQNFRVQDLGTPQGLSRQVPEDADVVFVLGPREPFAAEEISALQRYAKSGGHLLLALDVDGRAASETNTPASSSVISEHKAPKDGKSASAKIAATVAGISGSGTGANLNDLAHILGLKVEVGTLANDRAFVQRKMNKSDYVQLVTNRFSSHASVTTLNRNNAGIVLFGTGALTKLDKSDNQINFVVHSLAGTYADQNGDFELDGAEARGNFELAAAVARPVTEGPPAKSATKDKKPEMRAFVLADADAFSDLVLMNAPSNRVFLVDAVRWLVGEESYAGEINSEEDVRIEHTKEKNVFWFYSTIFGAPAAVLGLGLFVARRNRAAGGKA
jgi:hypothetical protein